MNSELLKSERFVFFERTPTVGIRYVRAMFAPPNTRPNPRMLAHKAIYGWTLDSKGTVIRVIFAECAPGPDGLPDGCGDYHASTLKDCEAGTWVGVTKPLGPMQVENSSPGLCAEERQARRETAEWWMQYFERQAADEPRLRNEQALKVAEAEARAAEVREAREKLDRDLAELAALRSEVKTLRPKSKTWFPFGR